MSRKGESVTLSLSAADKAKLESIAIQFGCTHGKRANISALLKDIANANLVVQWGDETPKAKRKDQQAKSAIEKIKQWLDELARSL